MGLKVDTIQNPSSATVNLTLDTSGNATVGNTIAMGSSFLRNRIINGDMRIDQRNAGASVSLSGLVNTYTLDRWVIRNDTDAVVSVQQSSTAPTGFNNSLLYTVTTADASLGATQNYSVQHRVEGFNMADFGWGTASAQTVTLSFWVRSSLTGTFGGAISNSAANRSYPFTYTISVANTWEQKTVTITGDTTGTWLTTNGIGAYIYLSTGTGSTVSGTAGAWAGADYRSVTGATSVVGTNGATFYITGVQLEAGTVATPFERQIYSTQLAQCQRYYERSYEYGTATGAVTTNGAAQLPIGASASYFQGIVPYVEKRAQPTLTIYDCAGNASRVTAISAGGAAQTDNNNVISTTSPGQRGGWLRIAALAGGTAVYHWVASAEL